MQNIKLINKFNVTCWKRLTHKLRNERHICRPTRFDPDFGRIVTFLGSASQRRAAAGVSLPLNLPRHVQAIVYCKISQRISISQAYHFFVFGKSKGHPRTRGDDRRHHLKSHRVTTCSIPRQQKLAVRSYAVYRLPKAALWLSASTEVDVLSGACVQNENDAKPDGWCAETTTALHRSAAATS